MLTCKVLGHSHGRPGSSSSSSSSSPGLGPGLPGLVGAGGAVGGAGIPLCSSFLRSCHHPPSRGLCCRLHPGGAGLPLSCGSCHGSFQQVLGWVLGLQHAETGLVVLWGGSSCWGGIFCLGPFGLCVQGGQHLCCRSHLSWDLHMKLLTSGSRWAPEGKVMRALIPVAQDK